jgi:DNA-binding transcriptional MerR regulator
MATAQAQQKLSLKQAAQLAGITAQTFNWYVNKGAILYTIDDLTGWRVYDRADVERLVEERANRQRKNA